MRKIDWSPLVVLLAAPLALLLPENFYLDERTSSLIIWVLLTLVVLRIIREIRIHKWRKQKAESDENEEELY